VSESNLDFLDIYFEKDTGVEDQAELAEMTRIVDDLL